MDSIPLIASSIMSKKLPAGSDGIVLDVKTGRGAFMKTLEDSIHLAEKMVSIGTMAGRRCSALITNMDIPLGYHIGNALEIKEAVDTLRGRGPKDLTAVCLEPERFEGAALIREWRPPQSGYVASMDAEGIGKAAVILGAGRSRQEDTIDDAAGLVLKKKYGDYVAAGDVLAELHTSQEDRLSEAVKCMEASYRLSRDEPEKVMMVCARVTKDEVIRY